MRHISDSITPYKEGSTALSSSFNNFPCLSEIFHDPNPEQSKKNTTLRGKKNSFFPIPGSKRLRLEVELRNLRATAHLHRPGPHCGQLGDAGRQVAPAGRQWMSSKQAANGMLGGLACLSRKVMVMTTVDVAWFCQGNRIKMERVRLLWFALPFGETSPTKGWEHTVFSSGGRWTDVERSTCGWPKRVGQNVLEQCKGQVLAPAIFRTNGWHVPPRFGFLWCLSEMLMYCTSFGKIKQILKHLGWYPPSKSVFDVSKEQLPLKSNDPGLRNNLFWSSNPIHSMHHVECPPQFWCRALYSQGHALRKTTDQPERWTIATNQQFWCVLLIQEMPFPNKNTPQISRFVVLSLESAIVLQWTPWLFMSQRPTTLKLLSWFNLWLIGFRIPNW